MYKLGALIAALLFAVLSVVPAAGADPVQVTIVAVDPSDFPTVRLVASITDAAGHPLDGVKATDLLVSEDGRAQRGSLQTIGQRQSLALVLALDVSGSMAGKPLADAKSALMSLVNTLDPNDSVALITFNTKATVAQGLTTDRNAIRAAINGAAANGDTAIFDATAAAMDLLAKADASSRRAIVLLTDGADNSSTVSLGTITTRLRSAGYPLYVVGLGSSLDNATLKALADAGNGGGLYIAPTSAQLAGIYAGLAQQIKTQYVITYDSNTTHAAAGSPITTTIQFVQAGTVLGTGRITFNVPVGRDVRAPTVAPSEVRLPSTALPPQSGAGYADPVVFGLLGSATALCLLLWVSTLLESRALFALEQGRLARYVGLGGDEPEARRSLWARAGRPALERLASPFGRLAPRGMVESTRRRLVQTGHAYDLTAVEFIGLRLGLGLLLAVVFTIVATLYRQQLAFDLLIGLVGLMFGYLVPGIWLDRAVRGRQHRILRALPSALDMLSLSASAGMTLDGALSQVAQRWRGPLSEDFRRLLVELNMGRDRRGALRAVGERTGVPEVVRFANAIVQADALGTPISRVLQEQAIEMRTRRRQRAEEAARKAPVKMLFPMVGLIFPALFVVILGPAVPRFLDLFTQVR